MAIYESKDALLASIKGIIGESTEDNVIEFLENVSDTYDSLVNSQADTTDWKQKYEENDAAWKKKYTDRFFGKSDDTAPTVQVTEPRVEDDAVTIDDLFTKKE